MTEPVTQLTMQEAFDKAALSVLEQGECSYKVDTCQYVTEKFDGTVLHCGVGFLLPDDEMCARWDENAWTMADLMLESTHNPQWLGEINQAGLSMLPSKFLYALQDAHDQCIAAVGSQFSRHFRLEMLRVANTYNLTVPFETTDLEGVGG